MHFYLYAKGEFNKFFWTELGRRNVAVIVLHARRRKDDDPFAQIVCLVLPRNQSETHSLEKK